MSPFGVVEAPRALILNEDAKRVGAPADPPELRNDDGVGHRWARSRTAAKTGATFPARNSSAGILKSRLGTIAFRPGCNGFGQP
jgi:hypothetical protein